MKRRLNRLSAILIEAILTNRPLHDTQAVARAFADNNISIDIALRVLTRPQLRRGYAPVRDGAYDETMPTRV